MISKAPTSPLLLVLGMAAVALPAHGQIRAQYDFTVEDGTTGTSLSVDSDATTTASAFGDNGTTTGDVSGGNDIFFVRTNGTPALATDLASAIANDSYIGFTLTNSSGGSIDLSLLSFDYWMTSNGPALNGESAVFSSLTGFTAGDELLTQVAGGGSDTISGSAPYELLLSDPAFTGIADATVIEFRFYLWDQTNASQPIHRFDNVVLSTVDPVMVLDPAGPNPDLAFGTSFEAAPGGLANRTVRYTNTSTMNDIEINSITLSNDGGGVFALVSPPATPFTLAAGGSFDVEVSSTSTATTSGAVAGQLDIDTDEDTLDNPQDKTLPISSEYYVPGTKLNPNPFMDSNLSRWGGFSSASQPGIAPGSAGMARVKGQGDAAANAPDSHYQSSIPAGASDFEITAYFTPIDVANFSDYVDPGESTTPDGDFLDRTFQFVIFDSTEDLPTDGAYGDAQSAHSLINLAYFPDGTPDDPGTADFYVFNGSSWDGTGIGAIEGSVDNDADGDPSNGVGDGQLDPSIDPLDVVNAYKLTLTGTDFGGGSPSYVITVTKVSGPDSFTTASSASLSSFENAGGTPAAYAFTTADLSFATNPESGFRPTFWVDDICFFSGSAPDPNLVILGDTSPTINVFDPATSGTGTLTVRNDGMSALNVSSISGAANGISVTSSDTFNLDANALEAVEITFDATAVAPDTAGAAELTINSNDPLNPMVVIPVEGGASSLSQLLANWDFEVAGVGTDNTFAIWQEGGTVTNVVAVPGLGAGSTTAAYVNRDGDFSDMTSALDPEVNNFTSEFDFAVKDTTDRALSVIHSAAGSGSQLNIRYQAGVWAAFNGSWQPLENLPAITPSEDNDGNGSLDDPGDVKEVYTLRVTGSDWGADTPTYGVELFDAAGSSLGSQTGLSFFQNSLPVGGLGTFYATCEFGTNPGWWIDDVAISGTVISDTSVAIDSVSGGPGSYTLNWTTDPGGSSVRVLLSTDGMQTFNEIDTGNTTGTFTAAGADAPAGRAFYRVETE